MTPRTRTISSLAALLAALGLGAPAQVSVLTVDDDQPADFAVLQDAVDAAGPGDVLLVASGSYAPIVVAGKGLVIMGTGAAIFETGMGTQPPVEVRDVPAAQSFVLAGFTVFNSSLNVPATFVISGCDGLVLLQDLFVDSYGAGALHVTGSDSVVVTTSLVQTNLVPAEPDGSVPPRAGLFAGEGSRVDAYDSLFVGSHGAFQIVGATPPLEPATGGPGVEVVDAIVTLHGGTAAGGTGNGFFDGECLFGGDGGPGALLLGAGGTPPQLLAHDASLDGGSGSFFHADCSPPPQAGLDLDVQAGAATIDPRAARLLEGPGDVSVGAPIALTLEGQPGDVALLFASTAPAPVFTASGVDLHLLPQGLVMLFAVPLAGRTLTLSGSVGALPPGLQAVVVPLQAVFLAADGDKLASGPTMLVVH